MSVERYWLRGHGVEWAPDPVLVETGQHDKDFDVVLDNLSVDDRHRMVGAILWRHWEKGAWMKKGPPGFDLESVNRRAGCFLDPVNMEASDAIR